MKQLEYSQDFITRAAQAKARGFNIYALINKYRAMSKTAELVPESVYMAVLDHYLTDGAKVRNAWPYFITVLRAKSEEYFSKKNEDEGKRYKNEPANMSVIMKAMSQR